MCTVFFIKKRFIRLFSNRWPPFFSSLGGRKRSLGSITHADIRVDPTVLRDGRVGEMLLCRIGGLSMVLAWHQALQVDKCAAGSAWRS